MKESLREGQSHARPCALGISLGSGFVRAPAGRAVAFIMAYGIPAAICVADEYAKGALLDLCRSLNIQLDLRGRLPAVDQFFDGAPF